MAPSPSQTGRVAQLVVILAVATAYAVVRYVVLGTTCAVNIPVYVLNKAFAIVGAAGILLAGLCRLRGRAESAIFWLRAAGWSALLHVLLTLSVMNRAYYGKFFDGEKLSFSGELAILLGTLTAAVWLAWSARKGPADSRLWGPLAGLLLAGHLLVMGWSGWLTPGKWPRGLPPITLICFILASAATATWSVRPRHPSPT